MIWRKHCTEILSVLINNVNILSEKATKKCIGFPNVASQYVSIVVRTCTGPRSRVLRKRSPGKIQEAPHLLVVRAGNSLNPGSVWLRQEAKRGAQWRRRRPDRGGDRAAATATNGVF